MLPSRKQIVKTALSCCKPLLRMLPLILFLVQRCIIKRHEVVNWRLTAFVTDANQCVCVCVQLPAANAQVSVLKEKGEEDTDGHEQKVSGKG